MPGISIRSSSVLEKGLKDDRRWMIVDEDNTFITQRDIPELALIEISNSEESLEFSYNDSSISIEKEFKGRGQNVEVWSDQVEAYESDPLFGAWIGDHLGMRARLIKMEESEKARTKMDHSLSFADGYPYLFLGTASMDDLNSRLERSLSILRFRPNVVFDGGMPYEEDEWDRFSAGDLEFIGVKPCIRCMMTTIDPETAEKSVEPLRTLSTYRRQDNGVIFGLNAFAKNEGHISVGDSLIVRTKRK